ncbi:hypothetical protein LshimejAT787_0802290 [Lyophyllum shimeji]|uniref:DUF6534 domain-containing protein n=1 Tax=Lyophyllum shimeji TaxID=47721 RepID=A0A9P3UP65_LYOSH|nr:hypothetical protein LshimejAT787_0802290 [Lyophyllum shimeji]
MSTCQFGSTAHPLNMRRASSFWRFAPLGPHNTSATKNSLPDFSIPRTGHNSKDTQEGRAVDNVINVNGCHCGQLERLRISRIEDRCRYGFNASREQHPNIAFLASIVPMFLGGLFHYGLFGALAAQTYHYLLHCHHTDRLVIKVMAYTVVALLTFQTIIMILVQWMLFVSQSGDLNFFKKITWEGLVVPALNATLATVVEVFFAWRIWSFKRTKLGLSIAVGIVALSLLQWSGAVADILLYAVQKPSAFYVNRRGDTALAVSLIATCICDTSIALTMLALLRQARQNAVFRRTDLLINRLIATSLESGAVTAIMAILELSSYAANRRSMVYVVIVSIRGNLYANVLFASLNRRKTAYQRRPSRSAANPLSMLRFAGDTDWTTSQVDGSWKASRTYRATNMKPEPLPGSAWIS